MVFTYTNELYHHGIKGQKWGVRRYQNTNGRLTNAGKKRYSDGNDSSKKSSKSKMSTAKKVAIGAAVVAAAAGVTYVAIKAKNNKAVDNGMQVVNNALNRSTPNSINRPGLAGAMDAASGLSRSSAPKPSATPSQVSRYTNNNLKRITMPNSTNQSITKYARGKVVTAEQLARDRKNSELIRKAEEARRKYERYDRAIRNVTNTDTGAIYIERARRY